MARNPAHAARPNRGDRVRRLHRPATVALGAATLAIALSTLATSAQAAHTTAPPGIAAAHSEPLPRGPSDAPSPCSSTDCIPRPAGPSAPEPAPQPATPTPGSGQHSAPGGITGWIAKGITSALNSFFRSAVDAALNPLLDLLGRTLLTTPSPSSLPRLGELWSNSWQITIACYVLLVAAAGVVLMAHGSVQTRYSAKELAPRIPLGFLIAGLSLFLAGKAVDVANALSAAVMGEGVDTGAAAATLQTFVLAALNANTGSLFFVLIGFAIAGTLAALLVGYAVRLTLTVILIAGAPLALMCHALPQTEGIARWWWRAFGGVLAIQVVQSLALITALRLFLSPNAAFAVFGGNRSGLVDLLVALSLFYVLFKIPFWILGSVRGSHGRSLIGGLVRTYVVYRTFGALRGRGRAGGGGGSGGSPPSPFSGGSPVPGSPPPPSGISPAAALRRTREGARLPRTTSHGSVGYSPRRTPELPSFRAPVPASPAGAGEPARSSSSPPPPPTFRGPGDPPSPAAPPRPWPRPTGPPAPPAFRAPLMHSAVPLVPHSSDSAGAHTSNPGRWPGASSQRPLPPGPATFRAPTPENPLAARPLPPRIAPPPATAFRAPPPVPSPKTPSISRPLPPPPTRSREQ